MITLFRRICPQLIIYLLIVLMFGARSYISLSVVCHGVPRCTAGCRVQIQAKIKQIGAVFCGKRSIETQVSVPNVRLSFCLSLYPSYLDFNDSGPAGVVV